MGIDAFMFCKTCNYTSECLGRAYQFKEELINKKLDKEIMEELEMIMKRFEISLRKTIYNDNFLTNYHSDLMEFWQQHREHDIWLINDFGKERIEDDKK